MLVPSLLVATGLTAYSVAAIRASSSSQIVLPRPTGHYNVGRTASVELIDYSRIQPFAPEIEPVKLGISLFYPVLTRQYTTPTAYFPAEVAAFEDITLSGKGLQSPNGTFERLALSLASDEACRDARHRPAVEFPLAIFMPGEGTTRLWYSQIASTIASNGYIVVAIDPPYNVDVVEYPDGSLAFLNSTLWGSLDPAVLLPTAYVGIESQVQDVRFVLDQLSNVTLAHTLVPNLPPSGLNTTTTAMFGHSLGGSTAYSISEQDSRILGGLDMDGGLFGPGNGTNKPFMIMASANHTRDPNGDYTQVSWAETWPNITGWRRHVMVAVSISLTTQFETFADHPGSYQEALHYDFSDYPIVFETLGITPGSTVASSENGTLTGTLEGHRALQIVTTYVTAFLDLIILGKRSALLDGPAIGFPEVTFEY
ncbi:hypothetical protein LTR85_009322 [Meristemomyces frigidus]|nr:hypothetical protein LTR85_009322 [Meristemomyces frigidus]